jgi:serine/threonine protein phosphatase PrpC
MEDAHCVALSLANHKHVTFMGLFDGHGGPDAATYMANNAARAIDMLKNPTLQDISNTIETLDSDFLRQKNKEHGCTSCIACISEQSIQPQRCVSSRKLTVANVNKARAFFQGKIRNV